jgi:transglutaminase-like putative cysteine protease
VALPAGDTHREPIKHLALRLHVVHHLRYRYERAAALGPQRLQMYPRLSAEQRLEHYVLEVNPQPSHRHRRLNAEGNHTEWLYFEGTHQALDIRLELTVRGEEVNPYAFMIYPFEAAVMPFTYAEPLDRLLAPYLDAGPAPAPMAAWARALLAEVGGQTVPFLVELSAVLQRDFAYVPRAQGPPFDPAETLANRAGACRDLSMLMLTACRAMGLAARFVSGYAWTDDTAASHELHAWVEVYLPGAGWCGFDPTMGGAAAENHIALAAAADHRRAAPAQGMYWGEGASSLETEVLVERWG